ncbi:dicarboxylate/amino acid:cation symporter [Lachnospiraceae bacterium 54-53]
MNRKKRSLTTWIVIAAFAGLAFGSLAGPWASNLKFLGTIFIRLIQMSVVLLVMTSVAGSLSGIQGEGAGRMGVTTFVCIVVFTLIAAGLGLVLGFIVQPGTGVAIGTVASSAEPVSADIRTTLTNFVSTNVFQAMSNGDMVPCIVFSILFGACAGIYGRRTKNTVVRELIQSVNEIVMEMIQTVMKLAPLGIFFLLADVAASTGFSVILPMIKFLGCLLIGDCLQLLLFGPFTGAFCGINPLKMPKKFARISMMAITTTSSAVCLPAEMDDMVNKFGVDKKVADFVGPIAMSMNSTGAVQCYVLAILFMSQATGIRLTPSQLALSVLLACLMCMGTIEGGTWDELRRSYPEDQRKSGASGTVYGDS